MMILFEPFERTRRIARVRSLLSRYLRPTLLVASVASAGCSSTTTIDYVVYDPAATGALERCDMSCPPTVSTCRIIDNCAADEARFLEECELAAGLTSGEEQLVECEEYRWSYDGPTGVGRLPSGASAQDVMRGRTAGDFFAEMARFETLAAHAFDQLARDLDGHGAPLDLVHACLTAADEERQHVALARGLARRFGAGERPLPDARVNDRPSLASLACHNAAEGCVRETLGVLVLAEQARHAVDHCVRRVLARIAEDESRHAMLSWQIDAWAWTQLDATQRASVELAREEAVAALDKGAARSGGPFERLAVWLGMPATGRASQMGADLRSALGFV